MCSQCRAPIINVHNTTVLMKRTYTLFVTNDELLASPYVRRFNFLYDLTLHLGQTEEVNFLLQEPLTKKQQDGLQLSYDTMSLDISRLKIIPFRYQTLITAHIVPKEIGTVRVEFSYPQAVAIQTRKPIVNVRQPASHTIGSPLRYLKSKKQ